MLLPWKEKGRLTKKSRTKLKQISLVYDDSAKHSTLSAMATAELYLCTTDMQRKALMPQMAIFSMPFLSSA